jgi:hypothetical protein
MKRILKVSAVLSWINLIFWGGFVAIGLLAAFVFQSFALMVIMFLLSSVILHSYAALQLQKSIRNPAIPLSSQTPTGIRFVGFFALFFAINLLGAGVTMLANTAEFVKTIIQNTQEMAKAMQAPPNDSVKDMTAAGVRFWAIFFLLIGLSTAGNIILNLRLLRWYMVNQQDKNKPV